MTRPNLTRDQVLQLNGVADLVTTGPVIVGLRGFYKADHSGKNERGVYDDACFVLAAGETEFKPFNWNTDPSVTRPGMAVLQPGTYKWKKGLHGIHHLDLTKKADKDAYDWLLTNVGKDHPDPKYRLTYWAFRQASAMTVLRDGQTVPETKTDPSEWPWIDGHHGGYNGTSSEGCQTVPIEQWQEERSFGYGLMDVYKTELITYHLLIY